MLILFMFFLIRFCGLATKKYPITDLCFHSHYQQNFMHSVAYECLSCVCVCIASYILILLPWFTSSLIVSSCVTLSSTPTLPSARIVSSMSGFLSPRTVRCHCLQGYGCNIFDSVPRWMRRTSTTPALPTSQYRVFCPRVSFSPSRVTISVYISLQSQSVSFFI